MREKEYQALAREAALLGQLTAVCGGTLGALRTLAAAFEGYPGQLDERVTSRIEPLPAVLMTAPLHPMAPVHTRVRETVVPTLLPTVSKPQVQALMAERRRETAVRALVSEQLFVPAPTAVVPDGGAVREAALDRWSEAVFNTVEQVFSIRQERLGTVERVGSTGLKPMPEWPSVMRERLPEAALTAAVRAREQVDRTRQAMPEQALSPSALLSVWQQVSLALAGERVLPLTAAAQRDPGRVEPWPVSAVPPVAVQTAAPTITNNFTGDISSEVDIDDLVKRITDSLQGNIFSGTTMAVQ